MLLKIDDSVSRVFFTKTAVVVEGDTEEIVLRQTIARLPKEARIRVFRDFEIVRARGKAAIIGLVKYFKSLGIDFYVIHDRDLGQPNAEVFNQPILDAVGDASRVTVLEECVEDLLGYMAPTKDKPYRAFRETETWGEKWEDIPESWRSIVSMVFRIE